jgi:hypothetical protein
VLSFIALNCTFETMRENERKFGRADPAWPKDKAFVRRGEIGSYKDEMPPENPGSILRRIDSGAQTDGLLVGRTSWRFARDYRTYSILLASARTLC